MNKIAIAICTYERVDGLARTLASIDQQRLHQLNEPQLCVVVIDNSAGATAQETVESFSASSRFDVIFVHEPRKGLAHARNAAIETVRSLEATHMAFIDDDEMAEPCWIEAMYGRLVASGCAAVLGPAYPLFTGAPPRHLPLMAYATAPRVSDGCASEGYTSNMLIDMAVVDALSLSFDHRFNAIGGEDTLFFKAFLAAGERIAWAPNAIVHEAVPPNRMRVRWLWLRWYRTGSIEAHLGAHATQSAAGRLRNLGKGLTRIAAGSGVVAVSALLSGWRRPDRTVASGYTLCRGAGLIANVLGRDYREYDKANYQ